MTIDSKTVDPKSFCEVWTKAASVSDVAKALDLEEAECSAVASKLRAAGAALKKFHRGRKLMVVDVGELNDIIKRASLPVAPAPQVKKGK